MCLYVYSGFYNDTLHATIRFKKSATDRCRKFRKIMECPSIEQISRECFWTFRDLSHLNGQARYLAITRLEQIIITQPEAFFRAISDLDYTDQLDIKDMMEIMPILP